MIFFIEQSPEPDLHRPSSAYETGAPLSGPPGQYADEERRDTNAPESEPPATEDGGIRIRTNFDVVPTAFRDVTSWDRTSAPRVSTERSTC